MFSVKIGKREIGKNKPVFIIAEAGVNYNNNLDLAYKMIDVASHAGADAIKFQTWITKEMQLRNSVKPTYQKKFKRKSYYEIIKKLEPSFNDQLKLFKRCKKRGIIFLSTPYDGKSVDFLDKLGVSAFKISSSDLTNHFLLRHVAKKRKPIILSTGLSNFNQVKKSVEFLEKLKMKNKLVLLQATSNYPTPHEDVNLRVISEYSKKFNVLVGFSDHTKDFVASIGATSLGACVLEKHFTLSRNLSGPDQLSSLEPKELKSWITHIRQLEKCFGQSRKVITSSDKKNLTMRKILVIKPIEKNKRITDKSLTTMRGKANGVLPMDENIKKIIGRKIKKDILQHTQFSWKMI